MTDLAPILQAFFTNRLITQRQASPNTIAAYRDTIKLLLAFTSARTGKPPARLLLADWDAPTISAFLTDLETVRGNSVTTRNARLSAIRTLFGYAAGCVPEHAADIARVLAIPAKRGDRTIVCYLTADEVDALLAAPDRTTWHGRRDHTLILLAVQTGLRVSELTKLTGADVHLGTGPHVFCHGKGRKDRCTPLTTQTVQVVHVWVTERGGLATDPVFCTSRGAMLSRDAIERLVAKHAHKAAQACPSLHAKTVTPHTLRHTCAMNLLHAGVDTSVIALWLGHESPDYTQVYLHADMTIKDKALGRVTPPDTTPGRYHAPDPLIAFLDSL